MGNLGYWTYGSIKVNSCIIITLENCSKYECKSANHCSQCQYICILDIYIKVNQSKNASKSNSSVLSVAVSEYICVFGNILWGPSVHLVKLTQ